MIVYRVEHKKDGNGPYVERDDVSLDSALNYFMKVTTKPNRHPLPYYDGICTDKVTQEHFCGFESEEALKAWFSEKWLKFLYSYDFTVYQYKVLKKKVLFGKKQLMFKKIDAKGREEMTFNEIFQKEKVNV